MGSSDEHFALGLNQGGFIFFIVLLVVCFPLAWIPFIVDSCKAKP